MVYIFQMFFIGQNLKHVYITFFFFFWIFDLLLINSRYLLFEVSEAVVQRSSCPEVFYTNGILKTFAKFTGKHLCQSLFCNKFADFSPATKKETLTQVFSCGFCKIFKNTFFTEHPQWLLLKFISHHIKEILHLNTNFMGNQS